MLDNLEDENIIKNRIFLRETVIKRLTNKYLDLISKLNSLTRSEISQAVKDILGEFDMVELSILKAENLKRLKDIEINGQNNTGLYLGIIFLNNLDDIIEDVAKDILSYEDKLVEAKQEKEYKIKCEEVAKIVNSYNSKELLQE
jgi:hypothetical protein